jgi:DNA-binding NarL/FixJ family response regulator
MNVVSFSGDAVPMRILVVDDHPLMADAIKLALLQLAGATRVDSAGNLERAFALAGEVPEPDLVLLDLGLPDCNGLEALTRFRERLPELPVVVVSGASDGASILGALDLGAMGYILKTSPKDVLLNAVRLVVSGGIYVPVEALKSHEGGAAELASATRPQGATRPDQIGLSARQADVLGLLLKGLPNKLIARKLDIAENTVKIHVSAVLRALGVSTRTQALIAASRLGLRLDAP